MGNLAHDGREQARGDEAVICKRARKRTDLRDRFATKYVVGQDGCWEWTAALDHWGYGHIHTGSEIDGNRRMEKAHRVSWKLHRGPVAEDLCVLHHCDNPRCVNPDHLFLGTHADNTEDKKKKGREARGERHGRAKLSDEQVREIRALEGVKSRREIAEIYGISSSTVTHILLGIIWAKPTSGLAA